ncbi:MAG: WYL domain-containing protein [Chloroflexota bacterium]|nr:WYL domain-containing protein [Chloroflexota bacterium]
MSRGSRESQWHVMRRCLAIIRRAQRCPASRDDLLEAALAQEEPGAREGTEKQVLYHRLEKDLGRIRNNLMVDLYCDRRTGAYTIRDTWLPLLDLPDEDLATMAWLEQTFDYDSPQHDEVHALLGRLRLYLGVERQGEIDRYRPSLAVDLGQRDEDEIEAAVWEGLTRALLERRQVEFLYLSPQYEDGQPRRHVAAPHERYFERGHYYLRAYCRRVTGPDGRAEPRCYIAYRVGRIMELKVLPQKMSPLSPAAPRYSVEYELSPQVARTGVTHQPEIEVREIERREDGSALVRGETENLFWAVRALLHYGSTCRVLGGPEVAREMREVVGRMADVYA